MFDKVSTHDMITLVYSFYQVHAGTTSFLTSVGNDKLIHMLDENTTTFDILRVLQAFSEISDNFAKLFVVLEQVFVRRFSQLTIDEITTCASGFAISGFGTPFF